MAKQNVAKLYGILHQEEEVLAQSASPHESSCFIRQQIQKVNQ